MIKLFSKWFSSKPVKEKQYKLPKLHIEETLESFDFIDLLYGDIDFTIEKLQELKKEYAEYDYLHIDIQDAIELIDKVDNSSLKKNILIKGFKNETDEEYEERLKGIQNHKAEKELLKELIEKYGVPE